MGESRCIDKRVACFGSTSSQCCSRAYTKVKGLGKARCAKAVHSQGKLFEKVWTATAVLNCSGWAASEVAQLNGAEAGVFARCGGGMGRDGQAVAVALPIADAQSLSHVDLPRSDVKTSDGWDELQATAFFGGFSTFGLHQCFPLLLFCCWSVLMHSTTTSHLHVLKPVAVVEFLEWMTLSARPWGLCIPPE